MVSSLESVGGLKGWKVRTISGEGLADETMIATRLFAARSARGLDPRCPDDRAAEACRHHPVRLRARFSQKRRCRKPTSILIRSQQLMLLRIERLLLELTTPD